MLNSTDLGGHGGGQHACARSAMHHRPGWITARAWAIALGAVLVLVAGGPTRAAAQASEMAGWVDPTLGTLMGRADYRLQIVPDQPVKGQATDLSYLQHNVTLVAPLWQNPRDEWAVSFRGRFVDTDTRAVLPDTGKRFPDELWDLRVGTTYRHRFDNGWVGGGSLTFGSASDKPFRSEDELIGQAIGFLRVPRGERDAWFFSLLYASDQEFLGGVPIPGVAYVWNPSERFRAVVGVPFSSVEFKPIESVTLEASYFPIREVHARATWVIFRPLRAFLAFDWDADHYFLAGRGDKDDRLFYYEKRVTAGARFDLRHFGIEVAGGYRFDRFYFEGESYSDRRENRIDVGDGPFVAVRLSARW